jgi:chaperone required for assembly of F1-ATPase
MNPAARFYRTVAVAEEGGAFRILLDGKSVKTPAHIVLSLPNHNLAEAVAAEWRAQEKQLNPSTMPLTRLAFAAQAIAETDRAKIADEILGYGKADLLCYRAEAPAALVARQTEQWNPLLDWAQERFGARLAVGAGIVFVEQPAENEAAFRPAIEPCDDFALVALHGATSITGSLVLALALAEGRLDAAAAFALSRLDETFQAEIWGKDAEAEARAQRLAAELAAVDGFWKLVRP